MVGNTHIASLVYLACRGVTEAGRSNKAATGHDGKGPPHAVLFKIGVP